MVRPGFPNAGRVARWLHENNGATCAVAARAGRVDVLRWMRAHGYGWDANTSAAAAYGGHLHVLKWLRRKGCPHDAETYDVAEVGSSLDIIMWLRESRPDWPRCRVVAALGSIDVLKWLHGAQCDGKCGARYTAALYGREDVLAWLEDRGEYFSSLVTEYAAAGGKLWMVKWLRLRAPWNAFVSLAAASHGHLHVLKWVVENGCPWSPQECKLASGDHPEVLRWISVNLTEGVQ